MYTAVARRCTRSVHAVNGRLHGHIHGTYTAVHTGHKHDGRVHGHGWTMYKARARPCTQSVHGRTWAMHMVRPCPEHGRVRSRYVAKHGRVRGPYPTVYVPYTWPCTGRVPCTRHGRLHGRLYCPCARPCTYHVHGRAWSVHDPNTAVYTVLYPVHGRVYGRVRSRVACTCMCLWPVYTAVHGRVQTAYGSCTWSVHDPNAAAAPTRPCLQPVPCTRPFTACTDRVHHDTVTRCIPGIAKVDNRNLLDGYYASPIIRSLEKDLFTFSVAVTF